MLYNVDGDNMENELREIVKILTDRHETLSAMESCTGGGICNAFTNIPGSSNIIKFGAVTYSNEYKLKMGVSSSVIENYTVYSVETAREMAKCISEFADSDYGIGVTGKLNRASVNNMNGNDNEVFVSVYEKSSGKNYDLNIFVSFENRADNKNMVIGGLCELLLSILK